MTTVWVLVAGTVGGAIAVILALFVGGWIFGRLQQRQMASLMVIQSEWAEHYAEHGEEIRRWHGRAIGWGLVMFVLVVVLLATSSWVLFIAVLVLLLPIGVILGGISTIKMRYYWDRGILRPARLLTGEQAVRRGWMFIALGVLILMWLLSQALRLSFTLY